MRIFIYEKRVYIRENKLPPHGRRRGGHRRGPRGQRGEGSRQAGRARGPRGGRLRLQRRLQPHGGAARGVSSAPAPRQPRRAVGL